MGTDRAIVNGAHTDSVLQNLVHIYVQGFVLCPNCNLPETKYKIKGGCIFHNCAACGAKDMLDMSHKLCTFILAQDKKDKEKKKKDKKKRKKRRRIRIRKRRRMVVMTIKKRKRTKRRKKKKKKRRKKRFWMNLTNLPLTMKLVLMMLPRWILLLKELESTWKSILMLPLQMFQRWLSTNRWL